MPNMKRVGSIWYFRLALPEEIAGLPVPDDWPDALAELVNAKTGRLKIEIQRSLGESDKRKADTHAARNKARFATLIVQAKAVLAGQAIPMAPLSDGDGKIILEWIEAKLLAGDDAIRRKGIGFRVDRSALLIPTDPPSSSEPWKPGDGLTEDDLELVKGLTNAISTPLASSIARGRADETARTLIREAAKALGIAVAAGSQAEQDLMLKATGRLQEALEKIEARNQGRFAQTPPLPRPEQTNGLKLSEALAEWSLDKPRRKGRPQKRSKGTIAEATRAVELWKQLHGDMRIGAIKRKQVTDYTAALLNIPAIRTRAEQKTSLSEFARRPLPANRKRLSPASINKNLGLLSAICEEAADTDDFKDLRGGWTSPFSDMALTVEGTTGERAVFTIDALKILLNDPEFVTGARTKGGRGIAARWLTLLALFTGARREELGQLKVKEIRQDSASGVWFIAFRATEGRSLKTSSSSRDTPIHPELIRCGFLDYWKRQHNHGPGAWLFPQLPETGDPGKRSDTFGRWFGRKTKKLGLRDAGGKTPDGEDLVFHSFRHTIADALRAATEDPERRYAITGHSADAPKNVGSSYGKGFQLSELSRVMEKVEFRGLDFSHMYPPSP